jgi:DNA-binding response OmpR family regulator
MRILLIEDDDLFADSMVRALTRGGHDSDRRSHGADAVVRYRQADLVLLDLLLPDGHGLDALRELRRASDIPVIVMTALGDERTVVRALRLGADDYLVKPFGEAELLARIDAVTRRSRIRRSEPSQRVVLVGDVKIDLGARRVWVGDSEIVFTSTEFGVLAALARRRGMAVSREQLMDEVWGDAFPARARALSVHMTGLRKKLDRPGLIVTKHGFGYLLEG